MTTKTFSESILVSKNLRGPARRVAAESINLAGSDFLASIHAEIGDWKNQEADALREYNAEKRAAAEAGLTSEINTKVDGFSVGETVERVEALLNRHQFGYKIEADDESPEKAEEALVRGMELAAAERQQAVAV